MEDCKSEINEATREQIESIVKRCERINPFVVINCITYNHVSFIRDALEGFVMQKTDFPFVAIVHDDASTDDTAAIIREYAEKYPDIIFPIYETENQYSKHDGSLGRIMQQARNATGAKYVAMCEGDDYWTDPMKLQKQVDFLESHPEYSMCHTGFFPVDEYSHRMTDKYLTEQINIAKLIKEDKLVAFYQRCNERLPKYQKYMEISESGARFWYLIVKGNYILTVTCMIRSSVKEKIAYAGYFDYGEFLAAARMGQIGYLGDVTSAYRFQPQSVMNDPSLFYEIVLKRSAYNVWGELKRVFQKDTDKEVMSRPEAKKMLVRKIFALWFNAPEYRRQYLTFVIRHPSIWPALLRYCLYRHPKLEEVFDKSNK